MDESSNWPGLMPVPGLCPTERSLSRNRALDPSQIRILGLRDDDAEQPRSRIMNATALGRGKKEIKDSKLELVRNSALAVELTGDQCAAFAELVTVRDLTDGQILVKQG